MGARKPRRRGGAPGMGNELYAAAMRELRRSNAAVKHLDRRTRRARTRQLQTRRSVRDQLD